MRLHKDRALLGLPVRANEDKAIPAPAIEAESQFTREFADETEFLQRELKDDVPGWLWPAASLLVLALSLAFVVSLAWGLGRVSQGVPPGEPRPPRAGGRGAIANAEPAGRVAPPEPAVAWAAFG